MKVKIPQNLINKEKYKLSYKSHVYKIKTMTKTSTNTHLILNYKSVYIFPDKCKKEM